MVIKDYHRKNAGEARQGVQRMVQPYEAQVRKIQLKQKSSGQWEVVSNSGNPVPATDYEVSLWFELVDARTKIAEMEKEQLILKERLESIWGLSIDYDGFATVEGLKSLIDEMAAYTSGKHDEAIKKLLEIT